MSYLPQGLRERIREEANSMNLREALDIVEASGFRHNAVADEVILEAARGLFLLYDGLELYRVSDYSAADQCQELYGLLGSVGLEVP